MSMTRALVAIAGMALLLAGSVLGVSTAATIGPSSDPAPLCATRGPVDGLSEAQAANARTIAATATARGGDRAELVAITVAITESNLLVLANPNDPDGASYPHQGIGSDHDSLGLFQQRPSWGSAAQRMDPVASTNLFLDALLKVRSWESLPPQVVAQMVQRSAFTGRPTAGNGGSAVLGGNYLRHLGEAAAVVAIIRKDAATLDCGASIDVPTVPGPVGEHGLPRDFTIPPASIRARAAVTYALAQVGKPYIWGGTGPTGFDCSGLMQQAWRHAGVSISRVVSTQLRDGTATTTDRLLPGDLVMTPGGLGTLAAPGHVGMYIGRGLVVQAPKTGDVVKVVTYRGFVSDGLSALRHIA